MRNILTQRQQWLCHADVTGRGLNRITKSAQLCLKMLTGSKGAMPTALCGHGKHRGSLHGHSEQWPWHPIPNADFGNLRQSERPASAAVIRPQPAAGHFAGKFIEVPMRYAAIHELSKADNAWAMLQILREEIF